MSHSYDPSLKHARLTKSKATSSTTAIQPLEITTTAVVTGGTGDEGGSGTAPNKFAERKATLTTSKSHLQPSSGQCTSSLTASPTTTKPSGDNGKEEKHVSSSHSPTIPALEKKGNSDATDPTDMQRKKSRHHHHRHFIKSPVFQHGDPLTSSVVTENVVSPLISPMASATLSATVTTLDTVFPGLPPPVAAGPSEAVVALHDAANGKIKL